MTHQHKQQGEEPSEIRNAHRVAIPTDGQEAKTADAEREPGKSAEERAKAALGAAEKEATVLLEEAKERLEPLDSWVKMTTREHPYLTVSSAMGVSFLAGFLMRRRAALGIGVALGFIGGCLISGSGVRAARQPRKA